MGAKAIFNNSEMGEWEIPCIGFCFDKVRNEEIVYDKAAAKEKHLTFVFIL